MIVWQNMVNKFQDCITSNPTWLCPPLIQDCAWNSINNARLVGVLVETKGSHYYLHVCHRVCRINSVLTQ